MKLPLPNFFCRDLIAFLLVLGAARKEREKGDNTSNCRPTLFDLWERKGRRISRNRISSYAPPTSASTSSRVTGGYDCFIGFLIKCAMIFLSKEQAFQSTSLACPALPETSALRHLRTHSIGKENVLRQEISLLASCPTRRTSERGESCTHIV